MHYQFLRNNNNMNVHTNFVHFQYGSLLSNMCFPKIHVNGEQIDNVLRFKYLRDILDHKLCFTNRICKEIVQKVKMSYIVLKIPNPNLSYLVKLVAPPPSPVSKSVLIK